MFEKLKTFNAWGMITVKGKKISVRLASIQKDGKPIKRVVDVVSDREMDITGITTIAVNIRSGDYELHVHEMGDAKLFPHPEVLKALEEAVDWIRTTANI